MDSKYYKRSVMNPQFNNKDEYIADKVAILRGQFLVKVTPKDMDHLKSLKTEHEIDRACTAIIKKYFDEQDKRHSNKRRKKR